MIKKLDLTWSLGLDLNTSTSRFMHEKASPMSCQRVARQLRCTVCVCICKSALVEVVQCGACLIAGDLMDGASDKCLQSEKE